MKNLRMVSGIIEREKVSLFFVFFVSIIVSMLEKNIFDFGLFFIFLILLWLRLFHLRSILLLRKFMTLICKDVVSNKNEREYIIRIPKDYDFKPENIKIQDLDYFIADENPLCVALLDHDDKEALYKIDGIEIKAHYYWKNNNSGALTFDNCSRKEFKEIYGFDPLPQLNITDFKIVPRKKRWDY
jgi:hypothetical protein